MTQKEFNEMPALLTPAHMRQITGLAPEGLKALRESNPTIVARQCGKRRFLYLKAVVAKLCGLEYQ